MEGFDNIASPFKAVSMAKNPTDFTEMGSLASVRLPRRIKQNQFLALIQSFHLPKTKTSTTTVKIRVSTTTTLLQYRIRR
eukprot:14864807-Ditylum_brightwellii.AAC.1